MSVSAPPETPRTATQFDGLRGWIEALRKEGELHQIDAEVDWD